MGNTLCGSVVVIAIPNAHAQDDATDSLSLRSFYGKNYVLLIMRSWMLLASIGGSYAAAGTYGVRGLSVVPGRITSIIIILLLLV